MEKVEEYHTLEDIDEHSNTHLLVQDEDSLQPAQVARASEEPR